MRPQKVENKQVLQALTSVLRTKGYEGASMADLAMASGLKKASLYHRFPGGKQDMTLAVLNYLEEEVHNSIYLVLTNKEEPLDKRLKTVITNTNLMYNGGKEVCMYRSLSLDSGMNLFGEILKKGIAKWINAFKSFGIEKGMTEKEAVENAQQTFIDIQGSLVLSKSIGETKPFTKTLQNIKKRYS